LYLQPETIGTVQSKYVHLSTFPACFIAAPDKERQEYTSVEKMEGQDLR